MPTMTYEELHKKTVAELREIAKGLTDDAVQGHTQMNKEHLLPAICHALGVETHTHHHAESGFDKGQVKARMRELRHQRDEATQGGDTERLHAIRREWHTLNHRIRSHTA